MREDNGVFRYFNNYKLKSVEMSIVLADYLQRKKLVLGMVRRSSFPVRADRPNWTSDWTASPRSAAGPGSYRRRASVDHPACIMLERWHHSSVNYSTQIQLAPQSSKLGSCARSTSRGTVLRNQAISVYGKTGLIDMASCCRCTASTRGLAIRLIGSSGQRLFQHRHTDQTPRKNKNCGQGFSNGG